VGTEGPGQEAGLFPKEIGSGRKYRGKLCNIICIKFCNCKSAKRPVPTKIGQESGLKGMGSGKLELPSQPLPLPICVTQSLKLPQEGGNFS